MLRLLFNGLMPKNDDNDGYEPHRIQLFRHCAASRRLSVCLSVIQLPEKQKKKPSQTLQAEWVLLDWVGVEWVVG